MYSLFIILVAILPMLICCAIGAFITDVVWPALERRHNRGHM